MKTFSHGIHPPGNKERTKDLPIVRFDAPEKVYIPLQQHIGKEAAPIVAVGDTVKKGQKIGETVGNISAAVFASVSGPVTAIEKRATATGHCMHVVIENDGRNEEELLPPLENPEPEMIVRRIADCGIVGMGGAGFPTAVKLTPREKIDTFIINGAECEPYLTCDFRIMTEYPRKMLAGAQYMAQALGLSRFTVALEDNKESAAEILRRTAQEEKIDADIVVCRTKYPQGAEKQLIYAVTGRKVCVGKLPASAGVIVSNVHTAYSVYEAVREGVKCTARVLTVSGDAAKNAGNFLVPTGTLISELTGEWDDAAKLVLGGPMMGFAEHNADLSVTKTTSGVLLLTAEETFSYEAEPCINCASCARACPMHLMPMYIDSYVLSGDAAGAEKYGAMNCIECGSCAYVCPAHRPLVQSMRLAKKKIRAKGRRV